MKWFYWLAALICTILLSTVVIGTLDTSYQTVTQSYENISQKDLNAPLISPDVAQFNLSVENHWKISPFFSDLEDVFYPFRQWRESPYHAIKMMGDYKELQDQLSSMEMIEKATKVRAMRSYFFAKRKNFRDSGLNNDFINKNNQWVSTLNEVIQRKARLINGSYDNSFVVLILMSLFFAGIYIISGLRAALISSIGLLCALILGSFDKVIDFAIPFHWFLLIWLCIFSVSNSSKNIFSVRSVLISMVLLTVATSSTLGAIIGIGMGFIILKFPFINKYVVPIYLFHPMGALYVATKKMRVPVLISLLGVSGLILLGGNMFSTPLLFTSPIAYLGPYGDTLNAILLIMISASFLSHYKVDQHKLTHPRGNDNYDCNNHDFRLAVISLEFLFSMESSNSMGKCFCFMCFFLGTKTSHLSDHQSLQK